MTPTRNVTGAAVGQVTATPRRVLRRLGIKVFKPRGVSGRGRR